ncbi:p-aminobenzoyl-glutamate transport protein [bioreactor metagenome]|uniref:p-aminobenzoyl-glutamate transport protein n=1 Tax=bioreactor metagenome TaxID=1076179 RepID=A0A644X147_9ZZZZ
MSNSTTLTNREKKGAFNHFLNGIEKVGNKLPDPVILFMIFCVIVVCLSWIGAKLGWSVIHPGTGDTVAVFNLLSRDGVQYMFQNAISNVTSFAPLGVCLVIMPAMGLLEQSGLFKAVFLNIGLSVNRRTLTTIIVFLGIIANFMSDIGIIVLPPLAAILFAAVGRNPLVGMCCAYAASTAGMTANLLVGVGDATTTAITISAAKLINPNFTLSPTCNWFFFAGAVLILTPVAVFVTEHIVEPRMGKWEGNDYAPKIDLETYRLSALEKSAMKKSGIFLLAVIGLFALAVIPSWGLLRNADGQSIFLSKTNQLSSIVTGLTLLLALPAIFYGKLTGTIKSGRDLSVACTKGISTIAPFLVICAVAGQFISYFGKTNLGLILAVNGAKGLQNLGIPPLPLLLLVILFFALINILIASSAAKWTLLAPIFVPMFMLMNYEPQIVQAAYRIGDSMTNAITPLLAYFTILLGFAKQYDKNAGIGTLLGMLVPYTLFYGLAWIIYFSVYFLTGLPFGIA